ncbi:hypothetical protein WJX72_010381 [[Myrmecia] bisecta]|uniref:Uncharacterized protein n=1 Tax=[Myrmecia] bisecta TaxID=41462 RepID=A0AAW1R982_9CHLO
MSATSVSPGSLELYELQQEVDRLRGQVQNRLAIGADHHHSATWLEAEDSAEAQQGHRPSAPGFWPEDEVVASTQTLPYTNGDTYEGETLNTLRHGHGVLQCVGGDRYEGQWRLDVREGRGKAVLANGVEYDGDWKADKAHGSGRAKYANGGVYEGEFHAELRSGWGLHKFPEDVGQYEGEWEQDRMHGKGRHTYPDGSYYEGGWARGERVQGKYVSADQSVEYVGAWKGELRHGFGTQVQTGLRRYSGEWINGYEHGRGKCMYADGSEYDGEWAIGVREGTGKMTAPNGYQYAGHWKDGARHGTGSCTFESGARYQGGWQHDKQSGQGRCLYACGDRYDGEWANGLRSGKGTCNFVNGDSYQGTWENDQRHGFGCCKFADGSLFRGDWEADGWVQSAADPGLTKVSGKGLARAQAGQDALFVIQARDELRNKRLSGGDEFKVMLRGPAEVYATVKDNSDGTYQATYQTVVAGQYQLHVLTGLDERVADSPYPLRVLSSLPDVRKTAVVGTGRSAAECGCPAEFYIEARDQYGNRCLGSMLPEGLSVEVELASGLINCQVNMRILKDGRYECHYTAQQPGFYRLHVLSTGKHVGGSPFSVQVTDQGAKETHANGAAAPAAAVQEPIIDRVKLWETIAAAQFSADGISEGWDSDVSDDETPEHKYLKAHPGVPVVDNLEDIWKVSKLQRERKQRAEQRKQAELQRMARLKAKAKEEIAQEARQLGYGSGWT